MKFVKFVIKMLSIFLLVEMLIGFSISQKYTIFNNFQFSTNTLVLVVKLVVFVSIFIVYKYLFNYKNKDENRYITILASLTVMFGWVGYLKYFYPNINIDTLVDVVYYVVQLFSLSVINDVVMNPYLNIARFLAILTVSGFILNVIKNETLEKLVIKFNYKNHVIICADNLSKDILNLIVQLKNKKIILIVNSEDTLTNDNIRVMKRDLNINTINIANIKKAKEVYLMCSNVEKNIELAHELYNQKEKNKNKLNCYVLCGNVNLSNYLYNKDIFKISYDTFDARFLNVNKSLAREMIYNNLQFKLDDFSCNILITGEGEFFQDILKEILVMYSYDLSNNDNQNNDNQNKKSNITILCENHTISKSFEEVFGQFIDFTVVSDITDITKKSYDVVFIANEDDYLCYESYRKIIQHNIDDNSEKILVVYKYGRKSDNLFNDDNKIQIIDTEDVSFDFEELDTDAELMHKIYLVDQYVNNLPEDEKEALQGKWDCVDDKSLEYFYQLYDLYLENTPNSDEWINLSESFKDSNRNAAIHLNELSKIFENSKCNYNEAYEKIAIKEHYRWYSTKLLNGYKYDVNKSDIRLTNDQLRVWQNSKNENKDANIRRIKKYIKIRNKNKKVILKSKKDVFLHIKLGNFTFNIQKDS